MGEIASLPDGRGYYFASIAMTLMVNSLGEEDQISPSKERWSKLTNGCHCEERSNLPANGEGS